MINQITLRQTANLVAITLVIGASWLYFDSEEEIPRQSATDEQIPDYQIENFAATRYDQNGSIAFELTGERLAHYDLIPDIAEIDHPRYIEYQQQIPQLEMTAVQGTTTNDSAVVELKQSVSIKKIADGAPPTTMNTDYLRITPQQHYAETPKAVTIIGPDFETSAIGMTIDTKQSIVKLLNDVHSVYTPQARE